MKFWDYIIPGRLPATEDDANKAIASANEALSEARKLGYDTSELEALLKQALSAFANHEYTIAIEYAEEIAGAVEELEMRPEVGEVSTVTKPIIPSVKRAQIKDLEQRYEVLELIGYGGFADVYKAKRREGSFILALKLPRITPYETVTLDSFLQEADLWIKLSHPHIVRVYEYGAKPYPWLAIEYMEGGSLRGRIGRLSIAESLQIGTKLAEALFYTSHLGVIHRDIKPENILFDLKDTPKLTDWGLGKVLLEASKSVSGFKGTLAYSAPEQVSDEFGSADWRTDIYQLGAVLYEMLTGERLFKGEGWDLIAKIRESEPRKPSELNSKVSEDLDLIVLKALAKRKEERYEDASALKKDLEKAAQW